MDYRRYVIIDVNETGSLDYSQLLQNNGRQLRVSGSKAAMVGWDTENSESMEMFNNYINRCRNLKYIILERF